MWLKGQPVLEASPLFLQGFPRCRWTSIDRFVVRRLLTTFFRRLALGHFNFRRPRV